MNPVHPKPRPPRRFESETNRGERVAPNRPDRPDRRDESRPASRTEDLAPTEAVVQLLAHWGERAAELQAKLTRYVEFLLVMNREFNLTADSEPIEQWRRHIEDTLLNARLIEQIAGRPGAGKRILDVGAGGGVPGLVWAVLWPEADVTLAEATLKKARFLSRAGRELGLEHLHVIPERAEILAHQAAHRETYDWVTARALAPLPTLAEWTLPFAKLGGHLFAIKGADLNEEMKASRRAFRLLGAPALPVVHAYTRSDGKSCNLLVYTKSDKTPSPYPRRVGIASKNPL